MPALDDQVITVYYYAASKGAIESVGSAAADLGIEAHHVLAAVTQLVELHLLRPDSETGHRLIPIDPEQAAAMLISPIEREIYKRREMIDRLRQRIDVITQPHTRGGRAATGAIERLSGVVEISGLLKLASDVCRDEVLILRSSQDNAEQFDELIEPCYGVLDRNVAVRVICPHRSRADFASRARTKRLVDAGAAVRTISQSPQAAVVFDRSHAVLFGVTDDGEPTARRVRDDKVVRFLVDLFNQLWDNAKPFNSAEPGYAEVVDDLQQAIVRLMAQGHTDEVVARKLGMSVRTCRRHIAALLRNLDSVSRFQAGVAAAHRFSIERVPVS
ncbi:MAG TPA: hypothetical protein VF054_06240 [Micromonosporaceae bacterium]